VAESIETSLRMDRPSQEDTGDCGEVLCISVYSTVLHTVYWKHNSGLVATNPGITDWLPGEAAQTPYAVCRVLFIPDWVNHTGVRCEHPAVQEYWSSVYGVLWHEYDVAVFEEGRYLPIFRNGGTFVFP
jgi:hypothetical protein